MILQKKYILFYSKTSTTPPTNSSSSLMVLIQPKINPTTLLILPNHVGISILPMQANRIGSSRTSSSRIPSMIDLTNSFSNKYEQIDATFRRDQFDYLSYEHSILYQWLNSPFMNRIFLYNGYLFQFATLCNKGIACTNWNLILQARG